jgi:hypothetical protein
MKVLSLISYCLLTTIMVHGQAVKKKKSAPIVNRTGMATTFGKDITAAGVKEQLYVIAGEEMQGRETATEGQRKAAAYIAGQFKAMGLQPGVNGKWEQFYSLYQDTLTNSTIIVGDSVYLFGKNFYASVKDNRTEQLDNVSVVYAGYGITSGNYDSYKGLDVAGKIVLLQQGEPRLGDTAFLLSGSRQGSEWSSVTKKATLAADMGAKAVFVISESLARMGAVSERMKRSGIYTASDEPTETKLNTYFISAEMAAYILGKSVDKEQAPANPEAVNKVTVNFAKGVNDMKTSNVLGYLEGADKKDEILFVTAHYDHLGVHDGKVYYGADDDGSGTSAVIEIAAAFAKAKKAGYGPRRSIVFMTVSGEEKGLLGSRYYTDFPVYPLEKTVVDLNIDMIGRIDPDHAKDSNYVYIIGDDKLSSELRTISEMANNMHTQLDLDYKYNDPEDSNRFYYRSDHYMFAQHNIPIIFYFNGVHADYHRPTDTVEKINYELLAKRARLVFYTAWDIANRNERLVVDRHEK